MGWKFKSGIICLNILISNVLLYDAALNQFPAVFTSYKNKKVLFLCAPHPQWTFFNYRKSFLPDWWINILPALSYWQPPSLITNWTHNSFSICYWDNNGSGKIQTHWILTLLFILLCIPSCLFFHFGFFFFHLLGQSYLEFFLPSSVHSMDLKSWSRADTLEFRKFRSTMLQDHSSKSSRGEAGKGV